MNGHDVLVDSRNAIEREGFNVLIFGLDPGAPCGTPRCILGWCRFSAGDWSGADPFELADAPVAYGEALEALWAARPDGFARWAEPSELVDELPYRVESVAFYLRGVKNILEWVDRAIALTAPPPPDLVLSGVGAAEVLA